MSDISTVLAALATERAALQTALSTATAQDAQASSVAAATHAALAAVQDLLTRTEAEQAQVKSSAAAVTAALAARTVALASVNDAQTKGTDPPLSDAQAGALKTAVASANGVSEPDLEGKGVAAVSKLDTEVAAIGTAEAAALTSAQNDLAAKQAVLVSSRATALALLASVQGSAADITARLSAAIARHDGARQLAAAADASSHHAAVVAYADYTGDRAALGNAAAADPSGQWAAAANAWLSALGDVAGAAETVIEKRLALDTALASQTARRQTRDNEAAVAAAAVLGQ